mmetsp:Transcript_20768/g.40632  ORF Transcript_20768/g.40632 Transcript_20768/m.40632 type:complete len:377 (+) Transcript_20768:127-1257(+)
MESSTREAGATPRGGAVAVVAGGWAEASSAPPTSQLPSSGCLESCGVGACRIAAGAVAGDELNGSSVAAATATSAARRAASAATCTAAATATCFVQRWEAAAEAAEDAAASARSWAATCNCLWGWQLPLSATLGTDGVVAAATRAAAASVPAAGAGPAEASASGADASLPSSSAWTLASKCSLSFSFFFFFRFELTPLPAMKSTRSSMSRFSSLGFGSSLCERQRSSERQMTHSTAGAAGLSRPSQSKAFAVQTSRKVSTLIHQRLRTIRLPMGRSTTSVTIRRKHCPRSIRMDSRRPVWGLARTGPAVILSCCCTVASCARMSSSNSMYSVPSASKAPSRTPASSGILLAFTICSVNKQLWYFCLALLWLGKAIM